MKISAIGNSLNQSQAAVLAVLAENIMEQCELYLKTNDDSRDDIKDTRQEVAEAHEVAYTLRCVAEQSILANDGQVLTYIKKVRENKDLADWLV